MKRHLRLAAAVILLVTLSACSGSGTADGTADMEATDVVSLAYVQRDDGPPRIRVVEPAPNALLRSPVTIRVAVRNLALAPAGRTLDSEGHWHVYVDRPCLETGEVVPRDDDHIHIGSGSDNASIELEPGLHELCIQVGDGFDVAVAVTDTIRVTVVE